MDDQFEKILEDATFQGSCLALMAEIADNTRPTDNSRVDEVLVMVESALRGAHRLADPACDEATRELGHLSDKALRHYRVFFAHLGPESWDCLRASSPLEMLEGLHRLLVTRRNEGHWDFASSEDREALFLLLETIRAHILRREARREGPQPCWG